MAKKRDSSTSLRIGTKYKKPQHFVLKALFYIDAT